MLRRFLTISSAASINRQIFHATSLVALCTVAVKLVALAKEQSIAAFFGTRAELNVFLLACVVPLFLIGVIGSSCNAAFIPTYVRVREQQGEGAARRLLAQVSSFLLLLLGGLALACYLGRELYLPYLTASYLAVDPQLAEQVLLILVPGIVASGFSSLWGSVLNAGQRFVGVSLAGAVTPLCILLLVFGAAHRYGVLAVAWGTTLGMLLEAAIKAGMLRRRGETLAFGRFWRRNEAFVLVLGQLFPVVCSSLLLSSSTLVDQTMAARLAPAGVAALGYGYRLIAFPLTVATTALGTAVVPFFATLVARCEYREIRNTLRKYLLGIFSGMSLAALLVGVLAQDIVRLVYQRGSFSAADTDSVSLVLLCFALQLPFYTSAVLLSRMVSALLQNRVMVYGNLLSLSLNVGFNYLFAQQFGIAGIALSTSCVYLVSFFYLFIFLRGYLDRQDRDAHAA